MARRLAFRRLLPASLVLLFAVGMGGCGGAAPVPTPTTRPIAPLATRPAEQPTRPAAATATRGPEAGPTAAAAAIATVPAGTPAAAPFKATPGFNWPRVASIGSASIGGTYYLWAGGWAKILSNLVLPTSVEVTGGPIPNLQLVDANQATFGYATHGALYEGWNGLEWAKGKRYQNVRTLFTMYASYFHFVAPSRNGLRTLRDLGGKVIGAGPAGGTADEYGARRLLQALDIRVSRIINSGYSDQNRQLREGQMAGYAMFAGPPQASAQELEAVEQVSFLAPSEEEILKFVEKNLYFARGVLRAGTYRSLREDLPTLTLWNSALTHRDVPEDLAYAVVRATFENQKELLASHPSAAETVPANVRYAVAPLHPGAVRYYREKGISIDPKLLP